MCLRLVFMFFFKGCYNTDQIVSSNHTPWSKTPKKILFWNISPSSCPVRSLEKERPCFICVCTFCIYWCFCGVYIFAFHDQYCLCAAVAYALGQALVLQTPKFFTFLHSNWSTTAKAIHVFNINNVHNMPTTNHRKLNASTALCITR